MQLFHTIHYTQTAIMKRTSQSENWRAFLKSPENSSGPKTFHGTFRARFFAFKKVFFKTSEAPFTRVRTNFCTDKNLHGSTLRSHGTGGTGQIF